MSSCAYKVKPIVNQSDMIINTSSPMYTLKNPQAFDVVECTSLQVRNPTGVEDKNLGNMMTSEIESRQEVILKQLENLQKRISTIKTKINEIQTPDVNANSQNVNGCQTVDVGDISSISGLLIKASPEFVPLSLLQLKKLWKEHGISLVFRIFWHSSVKLLPENAKKFAQELLKTEQNNDVRVNVEFIWMNVGANCELTTASSSSTAINGEVNILRFFSRIGPSIYNYDITNTIESSNCDNLLDHCHRMAYSDTKTEQIAITRKLMGCLDKNGSRWFGRQCGVVDIAAYSIIKQAAIENDLTQVAKKWLEYVEQFFE